MFNFNKSENIYMMTALTLTSDGRPELRRSERTPSNYSARADFGDGSEPLPCLISDISNRGARLTLIDADEFPEKISLVLSYDGEVRQRCRVVWRDGARAGLEFVS